MAGQGSQLDESRFSPLGVELVPAYHSGPVLQKEVPRARCPKELGRGDWRDLGLVFERLWCGSVGRKRDITHKYMIYIYICMNLYIVHVLNA